MRNIIFKTLFSISLVIIILILVLNINTFYWADDYFFMMSTTKNGILKHCINGYYASDGRFLSIGAFVQGFLLRYFSVQFITLFWNVCFLISGILTFYIAKEDLNLKISKKYSLLFGLITSIIIWVGSYTHIAQTVYWATGGVYSFSLLVGFLWIMLYNYKLKNNQYFKHLILFLSFSFIAGSTTQNLSISIIALVFINILIDVFNKKYVNLKFNILTILFLIAGILFISLAPGSEKRIAIVNEPQYNSIKYFLINLYKISKYFFTQNLILIVLSIIISFFFRMSIFNSMINLKKIKFIFPNNPTNIIKFLKSYKWLLIAISSYLPFIIVPNAVAERTVIYFGFFIVVFILITILKIDSSSEIINKFYKKIIYSLVLLLAIGSFYYLIFNIEKGFELKKEITKREKLLTNGKNKIITISVIPKNMKSSCYNFFDLTTWYKSDHWMNAGYEQYYGLKNIIVVNKSNK